MASIDKIYGNKKQYFEFHKWCEENYPKALPYFYYNKDEWDNLDSEEIMVIANFSEKIDMYLLHNCEIIWVVERIIEQYGLRE